MDDRIDPGRGRDMGRKAKRQAGVQRRPVGHQGTRIDGQLHPALASDHRDWRRLRPRTGSRRDQRQRQARPLRDVDAPNLIKLVARAEQVGGKLCDIHRAAAAETDDMSDVMTPT